MEQIRNIDEIIEKINQSSLVDRPKWFETLNFVLYPVEFKETDAELVFQGIKETLEETGININYRIEHDNEDAVKLIKSASSKRRVYARQIIDYWIEHHDNTARMFLTDLFFDRTDVGRLSDEDTGMGHFKYGFSLIGTGGNADPTYLRLMGKHEIGHLLTDIYHHSSYNSLNWGLKLPEEGHCTANPRNKGEHFCDLCKETIPAFFNKFMNSLTKGRNKEISETTKEAIKKWYANNT